MPRSKLSHPGGTYLLVVKLTSKGFLIYTKMNLVQATKPIDCAMVVVRTALLPGPASVKNDK